MTLDREAMKYGPEESCVMCGHPMGQHSYTFGCIARDENGDCECEERR